MGWNFGHLPALAEPQTLRYALRQVDRGYSDSLDPCVVQCLVNEYLINGGVRPMLTGKGMRTLDNLISEAAKK